MSSKKNRDEIFMNEALKEAWKGKGLTSPNPAVGAVIVHKNKIIGRGFHLKAGFPHAEIEALKSIDFKAPENSEMYVTLEPCSHWGKTPPCAEALIKHKFKRVIIGILDPNPLVNGRGKTMLEKAGIDVTSGILEKKCFEINEDFFFAIVNKLPYITLKCAVTLDGKIASVTGNAKWISNDKSRVFAHYLRKINAAVMVGINTVLNDDPELNIRLYKNNNKQCCKIIIVDPELKTPEKCKILKVNPPENVFIFIDKKKAAKNKINFFQKNKVNLIPLAVDKNGHFKLSQGLKKLYGMGIISILVEGGGTLAYHLFRENSVNKIHYIFAPKILGHGIQSVNGLLTESIQHSIQIKNVSIKRSGCDLIYTGFIEKNNRFHFSC